MNFGLIFCTVVDPIIVYIKIFCLDFFETLKCHFRIFFRKRATWSPSSIRGFRSAKGKSGWIDIAYTEGKPHLLHIKVRKYNTPSMSKYSPYLSFSKTQMVWSLTKYLEKNANIYAIKSTLLGSLRNTLSYIISIWHCRFCYIFLHTWSQFTLFDIKKN
jgi:hypothetical protein